ncbi:MAG: LPS-assembly protein LptD [Hyphomicrobium sp.]|nr:LPS-assembly protein LptD [Hyphomicrobium sp.]
MRALRTPQALEGASIAADAHRSTVSAARMCVRTLARFALSLVVLAFPALPSAAEQSAFPKPKGGIFGETQKVDSALPLHLQADELIYDNAGDKVIARGNVEIQYENNNLTADEVVYDQSANTLSAAGNVVVREANGNIIRAERYNVTDDFRDGFVQSLSVVARDNSRISAEQGSRRDGNVTEFSNAKFTPCSSDGTSPPLWCLAASTVVHDQANATISYQDAQFELFGVPILYMPYFEHPDPSVKRKSGFLAPGYGTSEDLGFFTEIPYYFALAPNYDFTFRPRYMTEQGVLYQGDWRHRTADGQYSVKIAGIDQNGEDLPDNRNFTEERRDELDGIRGSIETKGDFSLSSWWSYGWDVTLESDDTFRRFYKLDNILLTDRVNNVFFRGMSERNYFGANLYHFGSLLSTDPDVAESRAHPIVDYNYIVDTPVVGGELSVSANALSFSRLDGVESSDDQHMQRAITEVKWRRRLTDAIGITYTPFGELRGDIYQYNNYRDPETGEIVSDETVARGVATGGVTVAYPWIATTPGASHIIEPIGQVVARQDNVNQRRLPVEDAKSLIFDDTNLFETSKFSGYDRIETGTRVNAGLQYTFQPWSGGYAKVLAGQSFHIAGENAYENETIVCDPDGAGPDPAVTVVAPGVDDSCNPVFSPKSGLETERSDYVLGAVMAPTDAFRLISQSRFDDDDLALRRQDAQVHVLFGPVTMGAGYSYRIADPEFENERQQEVLASVGLNLTDRWRLSGGMRYDLEEEGFLTDTIQLRYLDDCFMLSVSYDEHFITNTEKEIEPDRTVMLRLEFKHLGGFRYKADAVDYVMGDQQAPNP